MKLTVPGELTGLNQYLTALNKSRWNGARIKKEDTETVAWLVKVQKLQPVQKYPVRIKYVWYLKNQKMDLDNIAFAKKFINDGLVLAGVLVNDGQKQIAGFEDDFFIDKINPRIEIHIQEN